MSFVSWKQWCAAGALAVAILAAGAKRKRTAGNNHRKVTDRAANRAVDQVQVAVVGTTLGALTNADGNFTIRGVPPGTYALRALRVGYSEQRSVTVAAGQPATANFVMESVPVSLARSSRRRPANSGASRSGTP